MPHNMLDLLLAVWGENNHMVRKANAVGSKESVFVQPRHGRSMQVIGLAQCRVAALVADNSYRDPTLPANDKKLSDPWERLGLQKTSPIDFPLQHGPEIIGQMHLNVPADFLLGFPDRLRNQAKFQAHVEKNAIVADNGVVEINADNRYRFHSQ